MADTRQVRITLPLVETSTQTDSSIFTSDKFIQNSINDGVPVTVGSVDTSSPSQPLKNGFVTSLQTAPNGTNKVSDVDVTVTYARKPMIMKRSELSSYLIALRPWSFPASITPVALGSCLAYKSQGVFDLSIFFTTILTALCVHAAGNLVNTYFDFVRGIDDKKSDDRTLVDSILSPNDVASLGAIFYIAGCAGCMLLNFLSSAKMEHLALIYFCGLSSSFLYTGGLGLKYIAMGDILIVLSFGPLTVVFSYLSQTGQLSLVPLIYAIPLALNTEAILHCNNTRDMDTDQKAGIVTMAILLGKSGSYFLFCLLLFLPYMLFIVIGINFTRWMLLPAASIFLAFNLEKQFRRGDLLKMPQKVAHLNLVLGVLFIIAVFMSSTDSLPTIAPFQ